MGARIELLLGKVTEVHYDPWEMFKGPSRYSVDYFNGVGWIGSTSIRHNKDFPLKLQQGDELEVLTVKHEKTGIRQIFGTRLAPDLCGKPADERVYSDFSREKPDRASEVYGDELPSIVDALYGRTEIVIELPRKIDETDFVID